jgi:hypothetical protein
MDIISLTTKKRRKARYDDNNKLLNNISNFGLNIDELAQVNRKGDYYKITIKATSKIYPLLTDYRINKAYLALSNEDIQQVIFYLDILDIYIDYGDDVIYYIFYKWFTDNDILVPDLIKKPTKSYNLLDKWIERNHSESLLGSFLIVGIGESDSGRPVVPEEWMNREFPSADELHIEMNTLEWRQNQPPVTYCCTYGMMKIEKNTWSSQPILTKPHILIEISNIDQYIIKPFKSNEFKPKSELVYIMHEDLLLGISMNNICQKPKYEKTVNVGILVSRIQKSIRTGRYSQNLLIDSINKLSKSPCYILPSTLLAFIHNYRRRRAPIYCER